MDAVGLPEIAVFVAQRRIVGKQNAVFRAHLPDSRAVVRDLPPELLLLTRDLLRGQDGADDDIRARQLLLQKLRRGLHRIGIDDGEEQEEESSFSFMPVGHGEQDMPSILAACEDAGANWVVVEQDDPAKGATRLESVKLSREYLQTLSW